MAQPIQHLFKRSPYTDADSREAKVWLNIIKAEKINLTSKHTPLTVVIQQRQSSHRSLDMQVSHATKIHTSRQGAQHSGFYVDCSEVD